MEIAKFAYSQRKWARRGRSIADFLASFLLVAVGHILTSACRAGYTLYGFLKKVISCHRTTRGKQTIKLQGAITLNAKKNIESTTNVAKEFQPICHKPNVRFSDIAGLENAKKDILLRMILPLQHPELAKKYGIRQGGGLLLYGPPGTGKTLLAKAVATEIDAPFYHIRPSDLVSGQVGQTEKNVSRLFQTLRKEKQAVLFIDEIEALIPSRCKNNSTIMRRVTSQILSEISGLADPSDNNCLLLIGATNEPNMIDKAMMRPGRFDTKVYVGLPNLEARRQILKANLACRPIADDVNLDKLAEQTEGMSGADLANIVGRAADKAFLGCLGEDGNSKPISMADFQCMMNDNNQDDLLHAVNQAT